MNDDPNHAIDPTPYDRDDAPIAQQPSPAHDSSGRPYLHCDACGALTSWVAPAAGVRYGRVTCVGCTPVRGRRRHPVAGPPPLAERLAAETAPLRAEIARLTAERDRLALTLRCERGEWAPEGWIAGGFGAGEIPDQWTRQWRDDRIAMVRRVRGRRWRWQSCGWGPAEVGYAPTALEAIEAADAAIREVADG